MKINRYAQTIFFIYLGLFLNIASANSADLAPPQLIIQNASVKLKEKLQDETFAQDFKKINGFVKDVIDPHVDFNRISALVLGKLWRKATREEKLNFKNEFHTLLIRTYSRAFVEFDDWTVRYLPLKASEGSKKIIVKTEILQPGKEPIGINYRMLQVKGNWKVYDIMIEGVSLVTNYRTSFKNEVKRTGSLQAVIDKLAQRNIEALGS